MSTRRPSVVLVEDEPQLQQALGRYLRSLELDCWCMADAEAALQYLADGHPCDVLVSDVSLPGMSGIELLERIRDMSCSLPAILISGLADAASIEAAQRLGAPLLPKPFPLARLSAAIREQIAKPAIA